MTQDHDSQYTWPLSQGFYSCYNRPPPCHFYHTKQVHEAHCYQVFPQEKSILHHHADGVFFLFDDWQHHPYPSIAVKTADCLPICLIGKKGIAMVHAGWRGIHKRVWQQCHLIDPIFAFIGPHICAEHYPVGNEFLDLFPSSPAIGNRQGKLHFNLAAEAMTRLLQDFPKLSINQSDICTFEQKALHSFRRQPGTGSLYHLWHNDVIINAK